MRITFTEALEIAFCCLPLDRVIISTAKFSAYRLSVRASGGANVLVTQD